MGIGNNLKKLLNERNLTVKEFAQQINVPATTLYSFIQRDSKNAKMDLLNKICCGLDIPLKELLTVYENGREPFVDLTKIATNDVAEAGLIVASEYGFIDKSKIAPTIAEQKQKDQLLASFEILNHYGKKEALKRINELTEIPRYTTTDTSKQNEE